MSKRTQVTPALRTRRRGRTAAAGMPDRALLDEIATYQEALLVQNEALTSAQAELEETRDRFIELYDFAPHGYVTLDHNGVIRQCNLTAAAFLGRSRSSLDGVPLLGFVTPEARRPYLEFLRQCRAGRAAVVEAEISLSVSDHCFIVQLLCHPQVGLAPARLLLTSIIDITDRRALERERARTSEARSALAIRLLTAVERERHRIASDLHDDIGQLLTAVRLTFERVAMTARLPASDVAAVIDIIAQLDQRLHIVATELRPASLDLGLLSAVRQLVKAWMATHLVPVTFEASRLADADLQGDAATHWYRIIQEALNNVAKHAAARRVSIRLTREDSQLILVIKDDGRGFDAGTASERPSPLGLIGMRERALLLGGTVDIRSATGKGTVISVVAPIQGRASETDGAPVDTVVGTTGEGSRKSGPPGRKPRR